MIPRFNVHSHTTYCDGKNTVEEMVKSAVELGCDGIGFSGHSYIDVYENDWTMTPDDTQKYISDVRLMKEKYKGVIEVLLGTEYDTFSNLDTTPYDYVIGSVHHVFKDGEYICVDLGVRGLKEAVDKYYGGDFYNLTEHYYRELSTVKKKSDCDIVGHFDIVAKFNEGERLFNTNAPRYRNAAFDCLDTLLQHDVIFEINAGAVIRGFKKTPYPASPILRRIVEKGGKVTVTTDCHYADKLLTAYDSSIEYARDNGVRELYFYKDGEFVPYKI